MENLNIALFEWINASPDASTTMVLLATFVAKYIIYLAGVAMMAGWFALDRQGRADLLQMFGAAVMTVAIVWLIRETFPTLRPFAMHLGTNFMPHDNTAGLPSNHTAVLCSLAFSCWFSTRLRRFFIPMLAVGLMVGTSRVYLGVHFPQDIIAALPVAFFAAWACWHIRELVRTASASKERSL